MLLTLRNRFTNLKVRREIADALCQGERDAFGNEKDIHDIIKKLRLDAKCFVIEGGDHSFKVPKSLGPQEKIYETIMDEVADWCQNRER